MRSRGGLRPSWSSDPVLPTSLVDLMDTTYCEIEDELDDYEGVETNDIDFDIFDKSDDEWSSPLYQ